MALKQLMIRKKIEKKRELLASLVTKETELTTRSSELETAIDEAKTDEEIELVEGEVETLETEKTELAGEKTTLETEISELETELEGLGSKDPVNTDPEVEKRSHVTNQVKQVRGEMPMSGLFRNMTFEQRSQIVTRNEVKEFLGQLRSLRDVSQVRGVTGADLTIPDVMLGIIRDNLQSYSKLISKVNKKTISGKGRQNISGSVPEAIWTEAVASINELDILFKQVEIDEFKVGGFIAIPNSTLEDSDLNLAAEILETLSKSIGLAVDKAILYGTGKKMLLGIATRLAQTEKPSDWSANAPEWNNLSVSNIVKLDSAALKSEEFFAELILKLGIVRPNYATGETFWAMNRKTKMLLMSKSIAFNAAGAVVASSMGKMPIENGDIVVLDFIPDGDIIGGYGSVYLLGERADITVGESKHVRFLQDQTVFKGTARYDGMPVFGDSFIMININNVIPTKEVTFSPDQTNIEDSYLSSLAIGSLELSPAFDPSIVSYKATTSNATNAITVAKLKDNALFTINVDGTPVANTDSATWTTGENIVTVKVSNGTTTRDYTVVVTKS